MTPKTHGVATSSLAEVTAISVVIIVRLPHEPCLQPIHRQPSRPRLPRINPQCFTPITSIVQALRQISPPDHKPALPLIRQSGHRVWERIFRRPRAKSPSVRCWRGAVRGTVPRALAVCSRTRGGTACRRRTGVLTLATQDARYKKTETKRGRANKYSKHLMFYRVVYGKGLDSTGGMGEKQHTHTHTHTPADVKSPNVSRQRTLYTEQTT